MIFVFIEGLIAWFGSAVQATERDLESVETRMLAFIATNYPEGEQQIKAFQKAVYAQFVYEQSDNSKEVLDLPTAVESFSTGSFSVKLKLGAKGQMLFPAGIVSEAMAHLQLAGLLYRGVYP